LLLAVLLARIEGAKARRRELLILRALLRENAKIRRELSAQKNAAKAAGGKAAIEKDAAEKDAGEKTGAEKPQEK
jgi:hypothetical protein